MEGSKGRETLAEAPIVFASHGQSFFVHWGMESMRLKIVPDELSVLTSLVGRRVVFTLSNGKEVMGRLAGVNKDLALLVIENPKKEVINYVKLNYVVTILCSVEVGGNEETETGSKEGGSTLLDNTNK